MTDQNTSMRRFDDVLIFPSLEEATQAFNELIEIADLYAVVSLVDLYDMANRRIPCKSLHSLGWTPADLKKGRVVSLPVRHAYTLELPWPTDQNDNKKEKPSARVLLMHQVRDYMQNRIGFDENGENRTDAINDMAVALLHGAMTADGLYRPVEALEAVCGKVLDILNNPKELLNFLYEKI